MIAAVAQFPVVDIGPLVLLAGLLLNARNFLTLLLVGLDLLFDYRHYLLVDAQVIVQSLGYEVVDIGAYGRAGVSVLLP